MPIGTILQVFSDDKNFDASLYDFRIEGSQVSYSLKGLNQWKELTSAIVGNSFLKGSLDFDKFKYKYIVDTSGKDQRVYSPTYSAGDASIAIGSRTVAAKQGATAMGTLSFALAENSTVMGIHTYVDSKAFGATAMGNESRAFAANTLAVGNSSESTSVGSTAFGNRSKAVGAGSIAIGEDVPSNAQIEDKYYKKMLMSIEKLH